MNLEKMNLVSLDAKDCQEIDGGIETNLWYDVSHFIGGVAAALSAFGSGATSGSANRFA
jgi:glycine/serine hydroxymethyltransferase